MTHYDASHAATFRRMLELRQRELSATLQNPGHLRQLAEGEAREPGDTKDLAYEQGEAGLADAISGHAAQELASTRAALARLADNSYGICLDCGQAIELRRLQALPETPCCTPCQSAREHPRSLAAPH